MMDLDTPTRVLLVEHDPSDVRWMRRALAGAGERAYQVEWATGLGDGLARLARGSIDVVVLGSVDLKLSNDHGPGALDQVVQLAPQALVLVLNPENDQEIGWQALVQGAQGHFAKGDAGAQGFLRALDTLIEHRATQDALSLSEARFRSMSNASPLGILVSDGQGACIYTNPAYQRISGLSFEQTLGTSWSAAIHPDDRPAVLARRREMERDHKPFQAEVRFLRLDGSVVWTRLNSAVTLDGATPRGHVQTVEDITERKVTEVVLQAAEETLFAEKERAQVTLNSIGDAVLSTDLAGNVTYLNLVAEVMTGWPLAEAHGRPLAEVFKIIDSTTRQSAPNPAQRAIAEDRTVGLAADCLLIRRDGFESAIEDSVAPIHNRDGQVAGAVIVFHDVSQSQAMARKMAHLAQHDFLTGLPNRALLTERLAQAIGLAHRHHAQVALLFLDLDHFKNINDSLGHGVGDQVLQAVAERLTQCVRATDTVGRQGGDEFVILLAEIDQPKDAAVVAEKLRAALAAPLRIGGHDLHVSLSIGIGIYPDDGTDVDAVMRCADTAMYHAKARGRNNHQFFTAEMNTRAVRRLAMEGRLHRALKDGEFELHYQPKVNLASGAMTGAEALIRWRDPDLGLVHPEQFVAIAEECGLIVPIGRWVLREACRQVQDWLQAGLRAVPVAVNISPVEFRHPDFLAGFTRILKETGVVPPYLQIELTESLLMHDTESSLAVVLALKELGVHLTIDDFGTGYSSLSYLKRFPIDALKIDQSFVRDIATDADDATIVSAVICMGINLQRRVIAEGVETGQQLAYLQSQRCDEGQGYLFSHPLPAGEFRRLLEKAGQEVGPGWSRAPGP